jgi:hypothetical protein
MATLIEHPHGQAAVIWVDGWHALVARTEHGCPTITEVDREADAQRDYLLRVAREADDCDRLMILGPGASVLAFESESAALYVRSTRFIDAETAASTTPADLIDRLHLLEPTEWRA